MRFNYEAFIAAMLLGATVSLFLAIPFGWLGPLSAVGPVLGIVPLLGRPLFSRSPAKRPTIRTMSGETGEDRAADVLDDPPEFLDAWVCSWSCLAPAPTADAEASPAPAMR